MPCFVLTTSWCLPLPSSSIWPWSLETPLSIQRQSLRLSCCLPSQGITLSSSVCFLPWAALGQFLLVIPVTIFCLPVPKRPCPQPASPLLGFSSAPCWPVPPSLHFPPNLSLAVDCVLVSYCCNNLSGLKQHKFILLWFWRPESKTDCKRSSRCWQGCLLSRSICFLLFHFWRPASPRLVRLPSASTSRLLP